MAIIRPLRGFTPKIGKNCFIAENAVIIGDVTIGDDCSIWYGVVLRGDVNTIKIGNRVNIQDNASVHTLYQRSVTVIGDDVSVGHNAVVHGAKVGNDVLVGMGAILMDNAEIPDVYAGVPAKKIKEGSEQITASAHKNAQGYLMYKDWYK